MSIMWLVLNMWPVVASVWTLPTRGTQCLAQQVDVANQKIFKAAMADDRILCNLLLDIEGASASAPVDWIYPDLIPRHRKGAQKWRPSMRWIL